MRARQNISTKPATLSSIATENIVITNSEINRPKPVVTETNKTLVTTVNTTNYTQPASQTWVK